MKRIKIMINGLPGNMAASVVKNAIKDDRFELIHQSLTGPEITETECIINSAVIHLVQPHHREEAYTELIKQEGVFISVDYTHPSAVNGNVEFYCKHDIPFVMGTTGGNRKIIEDTVLLSSIPAVIAPNMAKQIVGFQAMMEWSAKNFPNLFAGYSLQIKESHQAGKADSSGTARAMIQYFNQLGIPFSEDDIIKERDPVKQKEDWGIPEAYIKGHGWHTYTLLSEDRTVKFKFSHNVNGRDIYAKGALDAVSFLFEKVKKGVKGKVYSMIDLLKS